MRRLLCFVRRRRGVSCTVCLKFVPSELILLAPCSQLLAPCPLPLALFGVSAPGLPNFFTPKSLDQKGAPAPWPSAALHVNRLRRASKTRLRLKQLLACLALVDRRSGVVTRGWELGAGSREQGAGNRELEQPPHKNTAQKQGPHKRPGSCRMHGNLI